MARQNGLGTFEFAVVLIILGILAALLFTRLAEVERETERLAVDLTVRNINVGLKLALGERIMRGEESRIPELLEKNPLEFLGQSEKLGAGGTAMAQDSWRYDPATHVLSYRPRLPEAFGGRTRLEWKLAGRTDALGRITGLRLESLK